MFKVLALLGYGITYSVYNYMAWIEVLHVVVGILQLRSSDNTALYIVSWSKASYLHTSLQQQQQVPVNDTLEL